MSAGKLAAGSVTSSAISCSVWNRADVVSLAFQYDQAASTLGYTSSALAKKADNIFAARVQVGLLLEETPNILLIVILSSLELASLWILIVCK